MVINVKICINFKEQIYYWDNLWVLTFRCNPIYAHKASTLPAALVSQSLNHFPGVVGFPPRPGTNGEGEVIWSQLLKTKLCHSSLEKLFYSSSLLLAAAGVTSSSLLVFTSPSLCVPTWRSYRECVFCSWQCVSLRWWDHGNPVPTSPAEHTSHPHFHPVTSQRIDFSMDHRTPASRDFAPEPLANVSVFATAPFLFGSKISIKFPTAAIMSPQARQPEVRHLYLKVLEDGRLKSVCQPAMFSWMILVRILASVHLPAAPQQFLACVYISAFTMTCPRALSNSA